MLDDGINAVELRLHEMTEKAFEEGFESLEDYLAYLQHERGEHELRHN